MPIQIETTCGCGATFLRISPGRPTTICHGCRKTRDLEGSRRYRRRLRERIGEAALKAYHCQKTKEWRVRHPDYKAVRDPIATRASKLRIKFGVTLEEYERLLVLQDGVCAICKRPCSSGRRLAVDHCHKTGMIRGLLCKACNTAIGFLDDSTHLLDRAMSYLRTAAEAANEGGGSRGVRSVYHST
jgi:hypothetical protein